MNEQVELLQQTHEQLWRPAFAQVHFSDTIPEVVAESEDEWWRKTDFDSGLTIDEESAGFAKIVKVPIGYRPWLGEYGLVLVDDLLRSQNARVDGLNQHTGNLHPDILREIKDRQGAVLALANYAPRDEKNGGNNGSNFYLAITDVGLEIYTTPLSFLTGLEARHRITALYEIPNKEHPEFNGDYEQFRSGRVVRTRRHPDHLVPVYEYRTREELIQAKQTGNHPPHIPKEQRVGKIMFIDKFGIMKIELADLRSFRKHEVGKFATIVIMNNGEEYEFGVEKSRDLTSAQLGALAVYSNCSDHSDKGSSTGFIDLAIRVDKDPTRSRDTAIYKVLEKIPALDPATAEVKLVA